MIEVKNLTKKYGPKTAVNNISFTVEDGEILGLLGPNGAGKSTTMNIMTGYISSTEGTVTIGGHEILQNPMGAKAGIGYLPEQPPLYPEMTIDGYLSFVYDLKKIGKKNKKEHIREVCALVGVADVYYRIIKNLSKGYRQRVGLAGALLGSPGVLILDEPTVGLDPKQITQIRGLIRELGKKHTVVLSSHILSEIQAVCDRVVVLSEGNLLADDTPENLSRKLSVDCSLTARIEGPEKGVCALLQKLPGAAHVEVLGIREESAHDYLIEVEKGHDLRRELFRRLADRGWPLLGLAVNQLSLEDVFLQLTGGDPRTGPEASGGASKAKGGKRT